MTSMSTVPVIIATSSSEVLPELRFIHFTTLENSSGFTSLYYPPFHILHCNATAVVTATTLRPSPGVFVFGSSSTRSKGKPRRPSCLRPGTTAHSTTCILFAATLLHYLATLGKRHVELWTPPPAAIRLSTRCIPRPRCMLALLPRPSLLSAESSPELAAHTTI